MIDVKAAREAYNDGTIDEIIWVKRKFRSADTMTKSEILPEFVYELEKNQLHYEAKQLVKRMANSASYEKEEKVQV